MKRAVKRLLLVVVLLLVVAGVAAGFVYSRVNEAYRGFESSEQFVDIPQGTGAVAIGARLAEAGVVRDPLTFRAALWLSGRARDLKAGEQITKHWMVDDVDCAAVLAKNGFPDAHKATMDSRVRLVVKCIADVKGSPFDPCAEVNVKLISA